MYSIARITLGEVGIHTRGVEYARESDLEAERLTRPDIVKNDLGESGIYITTPHIINSPGYYFAYGEAALYERALSHSLRQANGTIFSPRTARCFIDDIMVGNTSSMRNRITKATGETDFNASAIQSFKDEYTAVSKM